ncbi:MAG: GAF domain-containing protein [Anaerolineae bacterium]|nr:GAF domain-containing protein [Anaerolineae bacterium]
MLGLVSISYALIVVGLTLVFQKFTDAQNPLVIAIAVFIIAIAFFPLRQVLERGLHRLFYRSQASYQNELQALSIELTKMLTPAEIARILCDHIQQSIFPEFVYVYLHDEEEGIFYPAAGGIAGASTEVVFPEDAMLVQILSEQESVLLDHNHFPASLASDQSRIRLIGCNLFIALPSRNNQLPNGWLAINRDVNQTPFTEPQVNFLQTISRQGAIAIERSMVVTHLEHRLTEMDVLGRISEGVNITLELNDILELIYYQTTQIVPADDFMVQLFDEDTGSFMNLFVVENNQRNEQKEIRILQSPSSPAMRILSTGNTIHTSAFSESFGVTTDGNLFHWIGTPLKSRDATIGVLSLGSRDAEVVYTQTHQKLLESIAGQAAGAIVKTRLIEETNQRAGQFSALNDVAQQLSATFNLTFLLKMVIEKAEEMLNAEAGSLLLFDDDRQELIFKVVTGPVASKLENRPLEKGPSIAWRAVDEKTSVINNATNNSTAWDKTVDQSTGFSTQSMLAAPLITQGQAIGVIEMVNKRDGQPFNTTDQEILEALSAQAAIAIENARLYTQTDEALTARVEDLSIMQNIDRELNASLDIRTAMRITLDHALKRSHADAAFIGSYLQDDQQIRVMASEGYQKDHFLTANEVIDISAFTTMTRVIDNAQPESVLIRNPIEALLSSAKRQTVIPITREQAVIGVLVLEQYNEHPVADEIMGFLNRLSDHASIAIYNAELYSQVQDANVAKSEFVSFVSHELKNPMTSIKGYTDLLLANAVGPITDPQKNFLQTIRSNVERMDMLVSDLSDVSRIEAGRLKLDFNAVDLRVTLDEVIRAQTAMLDAKQQQLVVEIPEDLPKIWVDRFRVAQILTNLISNANKYSPDQGAILCTAQARTNVWDQHGAPQVVHIQVKDTGMGIAPEDQRRIFQKFFRTEGAKASDVPGTGLGLNITKNLVEMQGGQIWFESELGKGTIFHVTLPIAS